MSIESPVRALCEPLLSHPDSLSVRCDRLGKNWVVRLSVDSEDRPALIGRQGGTIRSIETILSTSLRAQVRLSIDET